MVGPDSEPLDRRALGHGRNSVSANRPSTCTPLARRAAAPCEAGRRGAGARTALSAGGASLPNVIHWGWRGAPAPSNPDPGDLSPGPPITPAAPFCPSHDGGLDGARSDSDGGDAAFRGSFRPQRGGAPPSEREALWLSRVCTTQVNNLVSIEYSPIQRHLLEPQRRKSSIISRPLADGFSGSH